MPRPRRLSPAFFCTAIAGLLSGLGCGLRTDPNSGGLICVEGDSGTETGEAEFGSCENPIPMEVIEGQVARGFVSGCSETDGFCEANGGEQVFKLTWPGPNDITLNFLPSETDINPVIRVVEVPSGDLAPCDSGEFAEELTCAPIVSDIPARSFYTRGGYDYYVIVDSTNGENGKFGFELITGWQAAGTECLDLAEPETIVLGQGGVYEWTATLQAGHGRIGSGGACNAPGEEDLFKIQVLDPGALHVAAQATDGGAPPVVAIRTNGCGGANQVGCAEAELGQTVSQLDYFFETPTTWNLVIDNPTDERVNYSFTAWLD